MLTSPWVDSGKPALVLGSRMISGEDLHVQIRKGIEWLDHHDVGHHDVIALQMSRDPAFLILFLAAVARGAAVLPMNSSYTAREIQFMLDDSAAVLAVTTNETADKLAPSRCRIVREQQAKSGIHHAKSAPPSQVDDNDVAMICYTSGTTGRPKGAVIRHRHLAAYIESLHTAWAWCAADVLVHALPLFHVHGLCVAQFGALHAGATTIWLDRFEPLEVLNTIERHRATIFMGVPTFHHRLVGLPPTTQIPDLSSMRLFTSGSAPLPATVHTAFERRFGHRIVERYGMTEVGIVLSNPLDGPRIPGTVGLPLPGVAAAVVDADGEPVGPGVIGEIVIRAPSVFDGYLGLPDQSKEVLRGGKMHTGDQGYVDANGYFVVVGRASDMVITGGLNVYPSEVESVVIGHPAVEQIAVVGVPDPDLGERVVAAWVGEATPASSLTQWARESLASYKVPKQWRRLTSLPTNAMGKVQKNVIREQWELTVRPARADEVERIADWNVQMARETEGIALDPAVTLAGCRAVFTGSVGADYWLAEAAGEVVGQLMVTHEWSDWRNQDVWWIQSVYVPTEHRGSGVFRSMYTALRGRALEAGAGGLRLYVDLRNTSARAVYTQIGMTGDHYQTFEDMFSEPPPLESL